MQVEPQELLTILQAAYPFHLLENDEVEKVYQHAAIYQYDVGQAIYQKRQIASRIYLLVQGVVKLTLTSSRGKIARTETVQLGSVFGMEGVDGQKRWSSAIADTQVVVLSFNLKHLQIILHDYPVLVDHFESLYRTARINFQLNFAWKESDENFYFADHRHPAVLLWSLITPAAVWMTGMMAFLLLLSSTKPGNTFAWYIAGGLTIAIVLWIVLLWIDWGNDYSIITNRRVLFQERIIMLYDSRQEAPINAVLSVGRDSTQIGRIFQFGELAVRTYTGVITLPAIRKPELVAEVIAYLQRQPMLPIGKRERVEQMAASLRNQLMGEQPGTENIAHPTGKPKLGFGSQLANLFMLRFEHNGNITYRTHWLIMLKKIFFPSLVLLFLQLALVARISGVFESIDLVGLTIVIGMLDLAALLWWVYQFADWRNDFYVITEDQVVDVYKKPLGTEDKRAAPLKNIQSINFKRNGLLGIFLNFGTVYILIGDNQLTFNNVFNPSEVQREIFRRLYAREYHLKEEEEKAEQVRIREWIEAYNKVLLTIEQEQAEQTSQNNVQENTVQNQVDEQGEQTTQIQGTIALEKPQDESN